MGFLPHTQEDLSDSATIKVAAVDANYYDYERSKNSLTELTGYRLQLIKGGVGVFGAINSDSIRINIK